MAHKKAGGSTGLGRDSLPKYLGIKLFAGELAKAGNIIVRQHGTIFHPGKNTALGKDYTLYATGKGVVGFAQKRVKTFKGVKRIKVVNVE